MRSVFWHGPGTRHAMSMKFHYERISLKLTIAKLCKKRNVPGSGVAREVV